jgi:fructose-bisphosphate aldolase class II
MILTTADLYKIAYGKYAIGAYNVNNLEPILGLFRGCIESQAPFIIQLSKSARQYPDKRMSEALIRTAKEIWPEAIFAVQSWARPANCPKYDASAPPSRVYERISI